MSDFLKDYSKLPEQLLSVVKDQAVSPLAFCTFDSSDCVSDCSKDSCGSDWVCKDETCKSDGGCTKDVAVSPPSGTGTLTLVSRTSNSVTLRLKSISNSDYYQTAYRKTSTFTATYGNVYGLSWTVYGLEPNTEYVFNYRGVNEGGFGSYMSSGLIVRTLSDFTSFDWTYAGMDENGSILYGSEKLKGYGIYIAADEWNELADLVSEKTGEYVAKVSSGTLISAHVVNTMASALGISTVYSGESLVSADFFNQLRSAYNNLG